MEPTPDYTGVAVLEILAEAHNYNRYLASLIDAELTEGCVVLDFGAGTGTFALPLQKRGVQVLCIEQDDALKTRLQKSGLTVFIGAGEVPDESIDVLYSFNVFEHILDDKLVIKELAKKLKKGGKMVVYVPAFPILFSEFDRKMGHYRRYRRTDLAHAVSLAEVHIVKVSYVDSLGFFAALVYKIFGSKNGDVDPALVSIFDRYIFPVSCILDAILGYFIGKNLYLVAERR